MNSAPYLDNSIPLLTEVISMEELHGNQPTAAAVTPTNDESSWEELEKTLNENVLRQLLTRVDNVLEHRVRDSLADVLQTAVDGLANDIRAGLSKSLEEIIQRTISQEISKIQSSQHK